jgi:Epoxide hydrolase N terminus
MTMRRPSQDAEAGPFPLAPTPIHVPDDVLTDLRRRLELTRWPDDAGNEDWYYSVNRTYLQELVEYWRTDYDWRKAETAINAYEHYHLQVEGVPVHFMRRPGVGPNPTPLICTHGWPWTFWHWAKVVDPLADPGAHGGDAAEAFEVIVPSFPGFGFSTPWAVSSGPDAVAAKSSPLGDGASPLPDHDRVDSVPWNPRRRVVAGSFRDETDHAPVPLHLEVRSVRRPICQEIDERDIAGVARGRAVVHERDCSCPSKARRSPPRRR